MVIFTYALRKSYAFAKNSARVIYEVEVPWQVEELENLTTWMEENHEHLRGRPADWIDRRKEDVFQ